MSITEARRRGSLIPDERVPLSGRAGPARTATGEDDANSFAFEQVFAHLLPFQFPDGLTPGDTSHPLAPIMATGGLVFPYNPTVSEGISVKYDQIELTHTNESYYAYKGTDNVRISITDAKWTCDTFENAVYALSVLHFFRSYSFMDFGRFKTGRPPSPMWFSAYGNYAFRRVPCFMETANWSFPNDVDYVGIPEFGSPEYTSRTLQRRRNASGKYTWLPVVFNVSSISLIVQHAPSYWTNWSLDDYYSGAMLRCDGTFHKIGPDPEAGDAVGVGVGNAKRVSRGLPDGF